MRSKYKVDGMSCSACASKVEKSIKNINGVKKAEANVVLGTVVVDFDENVTSTKDIKMAVEKEGYIFASNDLQRNIDEKKELKKRLIISLCFMLPLMYVSMSNVTSFSVLQMVFVLPIIIVNFKCYRSGFAKLIKKSPNMDSLIAIGSLASLILLYFESAGMILTLVTLGKYIESVSKGKSGEAIKKLIDLAPKKAFLVVEYGKEKEHEEEIDAAKIKEGDLIAVRVGETVPADGIIIKGAAAINEGAITGENIPKDKDVGDEVICATVNESGYFVMKVTRTGKDTTLSKIISLVEEASASKAPIGRLADRISGIFVPIVMGTALATSAIWMIAGQTGEFAVTRGIAVLVISCPCALGLATPVAIVTGMGRGAKEGILIKSSEVLERLGSVDTVVVDKTGTITHGTPRITDVICIGRSSKKELLKIAASVEYGSSHPLAKAIVEEAEKLNLEIMKPEICETKPGKGVLATIGKDSYFAGNSLFMEENKVEGINNEMKAIEENLKKEGKPFIMIGRNKRICGVIAFSDKIRMESKETIDKLKRRKIEVIMITGDNEGAAKGVANEVGINTVFAQVLPEGKEEIVGRLKEEGKIVMMAGDGINDAPAITRADVGVAVGAGTDIAIESADIILEGNSIRGIASSIELGKAVMKNIKENLFWAFIYNIVGIPIAAGLLYPFTGLLLEPMIAAAAMSISSICVVVNSLKLRETAI